MNEVHVVPKLPVDPAAQAQHQIADDTQGCDRALAQVFYFCSIQVGCKVDLHQYRWSEDRLAYLIDRVGRLPGSIGARKSGHLYWVESCITPQLGSKGSRSHTPLSVWTIRPGRKAEVHIEFDVAHDA